MPRYSIVCNGEEVWPLWVNRKESVDLALRQLNTDRKQIKVQLATPEFHEYYRKAQKKISNQNLGIKGPETDEMELKRWVDYRYPYLSYRNVIACPHCGRIMNEAIDDTCTEDIMGVLDIYGSQDGMLVLNGEGMHTSSDSCVCEHCGQVININYYNDDSNLLPRSITLFEDGDKLICSGFVNSFYLNPKAKNIAMKAFRTRVVFNTRTGQTYILPEKDLNGKVVSGYGTPHIINCTYTGCVYNSALYKQWKEPCFQKAIIKELLIKHGQSNNIDTWFNAIDKWNDSNFNVYSIMAMITLFNRFPMLDINSIEKLGTFMRIKPIRENMSKLFHRVTTTHNVSEFIAAVDLNLPKTKTFKRLTVEDILNIFKLNTFYKYGFRKVDLMPRFCSIRHNSIVLGDVLGDADYSKKKNKFVKALIAKRGDVVAMNLLCSQHGYLLGDTAIMYEKLLPHDILSEDDFKGNLKEIHDKFSKLVNKIKFANLSIPYLKKEIEKYNMQINDLTFKLADDTHELIKIGQAMGICVGGYGDRAVSRGCTIVAAYDDSHTPKICIELIHGNYLHQAKAIYNNRVQGNLAFALKEWVEKTGVNTENCPDYQHILEGKIELDESKCYSSRCDFHNLEIDENGNVVIARRNRAANNNPDNAFVNDDLEF
jgi:hypothetical protein